MLTLRRLLAAHDEAIIEAGTAWVRDAAAVDLAEQPLAETRAAFLTAQHIVHNLVTDLLRGTIVARAAPERGATFIVRFPARPGDL